MATSDPNFLEALARAPRIRCAHLPTPLEPMERLSAHLGGPKIWVKRDDCTGLATGGNKARKLEYLIGEALEQGADTVITQGAVQSNHARQTAAVAARHGLDCHLLFEHRVADPDHEYVSSGNVLLDRLLGAQISEFPANTDMAAAMETLAASLRQDGKTPYIIPGGGSNPVGACGYVSAALELLDQADRAQLRISAIVHATGSAGTQAGLVAGLHGAGREVPVLGIGVRSPREKQEEMVYDLACRTVAKLGVATALARERVHANCSYVGSGYGVPTEGMCEAVRLLAQLEGILLDPVYSGKGMAGLIDLVRKGAFGPDEDVVFVHTGGSAALFGYRTAFSLEEKVLRTA